MASKLLDPKSEDTNPVFLRTVYDDIATLPELDRRKHRVLKIRLLKEKKVVGHEFLVLDIFDKKTLVRLIVERRPSRRKAGRPQYQWWNLFKLDFLVSDGDDVFKKVPEEFSPEPYHLITTLSADIDEAPTFAFICQIMGEVQRDAPDYMLLRRQCYWFTGTVIERVKHEFTKLEGKGEFTMKVKDGPEATLRGRPAGVLRFLNWKVLKVYPEPKAAQYVVNQVKREEDEKREKEEAARQKMRAAVKSAITTVEDEHRKSKEVMLRTVQPLLTTPEAYQRTHWANTIANVDEESRKSKEDLQRAARSLIEVPAARHADVQHWQSVFRDATIGSRA
ncbi:hypothetical protein OG21DRAFT_1500654 [Imleria badia]|nr:hypothetical protein OG21DRAFT_1500654 [Imleria badia]